PSSTSCTTSWPPSPATPRWRPTELPSRTVTARPRSATLSSVRARAENERRSRTGRRFRNRVAGTDRKEGAMKRVFPKWAKLGLVVVVAGVGLAVATGATAKKAANIQVCVLLPDTKSSVRWVQFDAPDFAKALKKAGVTYSITNALNDPQKMVSQADSGLSRG